MSNAKKGKTQRKKLRIEMTRLTAVGWSVGLFFVLLWMFFLGVLVGKGITPAHINLSGIKKRMIAEGVWPGSGSPQEQVTSSQDANTRKNIPLEDLEFYEELNKKKKARLGSVAKNDISSQKTLQSGAADRTGSTAEQVRSGADEIKQSSERFTVQVVSFKDLASAERFAVQLGNLKSQATIIPVDLPGKGRWYRVQVGRLASHDKASALARRLSKQYQLQCIVMRLDD